MYRIKDGIDLKILYRYGFRLCREYPDNERCICNDLDRDDYWLIPFHPDETNEIFYADEEFDQPIWSIHVQPTRRLYIDCVPCCTYHIDNIDMEYMFYILMKMIEDGIIYDDYTGGV